MKRPICSIPKQCVHRQRPSQRENSENHLLIHEGWSERHQGVCLGTRYTARFSVGKCPLKCSLVKVAKKLDNTVLVVVRFGTEEKQTISHCTLLTTMDM